MADAGLEVELKLQADDDAVLDELARIPALDGVDLGDAVTFEELDTYLDTTGGAFAAARWACRLRARGGRRWISFKGPPREVGEPLQRRPEVEGPVGDPSKPSSWPASPARELAVRQAGDAPLVERLSLRQRRTERDVRVGARRLGHLTLDRVEVSVAGRWVGRLAIVELELAVGTAPDGPVNEAMRALLAHPRLRPEPASKLELALALAQGR